MSRLYEARQISTESELDNLPEGSFVIDAVGLVGTLEQYPAGSGSFAWLTEEGGCLDSSLLPAEAFIPYKEAS